MDLSGLGPVAIGDCAHNENSESRCLSQIEGLRRLISVCHCECEGEKFNKSGLLVLAWKFTS